MAFDTETLMELGLDKDQIKAVMKARGLEVNELKQQVATLTAERDSAAELAADVKAQLAKAQEQAERGSAFETEAQKLQDQLTELTAQADAKLLATQKQYEIQTALMQSGARNAKAVQALLDAEKVTYEDGKLSGLAEQLDTIKAENDFLFEASAEPTPEPVEEKIPGVQVFPKGNPSVGDVSASEGKTEKLDYQQLLALKKSDPDAYKAVMQNGGND